MWERGTLVLTTHYWYVPNWPVRLVAKARVEIGPNSVTVAKCLRLPNKFSRLYN